MNTTIRKYWTDFKALDKRRARALQFLVAALLFWVIANWTDSRTLANWSLVPVLLVLVYIGHIAPARKATGEEEGKP